MPHAGQAAPLQHARAHWLAPEVMAWDRAAPPGAACALWADPDGALAAAAGVVRPGPRSRRFELSPMPGGLPPGLRARFPHLAGCAALRLPPEAVRAAAELLRGQLAVVSGTASGQSAATGLQLAGVLDALYACDLPLGPVYDGDQLTLRVWAPTARAVTLLLFEDARPECPARATPMARDDATGTFSHAGPRAALDRRYYLYEVEVWVPSTGRVERNRVTDPYAVSLARNGSRSQAVDLAEPDAALVPAGFAEHRAPPRIPFTEASIYELHVRDFSALDPAVPAPLRGTFLAFACPEAAGVRHLARLAAAGLTHVHLLPAFDFATVDEDRSRWRAPAPEALAALPPAGEEQQRRVMADASEDGFNWGYDPHHYGAPEGSYATDPDGTPRLLEFRRMVQALHGLGLRVALDVVYNHTFAAGQSPLAVLDRVVPGYYHRLDADGRVLAESCCPDTASEHAMVERLIVDSVVTWARRHRVDAFRFDIMGLHMRATMLRVRAALDALTPEADGVDGRAVHLYGEGWDFGAVRGGARGPNATQVRLAGTGIATFNDRLRDAVRGGGHGQPRAVQGWATGLALTPNEVAGEDPEAPARLLALADLVRLGLSANLADLELTAADGRRVRGRDLDYHGQPAGYALRPDDVVNYVGCHDDPTWFDQVQVKLPRATPLADRVRVHHLGVALVLLAQGVPFLMGGEDLLRSKSGDRNSYASGDWFNRLDFTGRTHAWGSGLPPASENAADWPLLRPLLADPALRPGPAEIAATAAFVEELLRIRYGARLFRLPTAELVRASLTHLNVGPAQLPGLLVLRIAPPGPPPAGEPAQAALLFNARPTPVVFGDAAFRGAPLALHPMQRAGCDPVVRSATFDPATGTFSVPGRTAAVFVG